MKNNLIEEVCSTLYKLTRQLSRLGAETHLVNFIIRNSPAIGCTNIELSVEDETVGHNFHLYIWNDKPEFTNVLYKNEYYRCVDYLKTEITRLSEDKKND